MLPGLDRGLETTGAILQSARDNANGAPLGERIVGKFKEETFYVIDTTPERLLEVPGIGADHKQKIIAAWAEQKKVKEIMVFLHGHGVSTNLAVKILQDLRDSALETVQNDVFILKGIVRFV